ncbi:MAG: glutamine-hydrolyzing carbamoyl-phosphate synthase small subunit [Chitinophagales bacterium]|nr:glutamine-hydrolyzing carbamoyl-phosphate synthase small subunit [Chitinophagales bacterium]MDW8393541.1 glutamine-hydrolyzing carbamoyl-phosphate synthase small subunit [Chitinophagales bacterium]
MVAASAKTPAVLLLDDGTVYHGTACGAIGTTAGEICFNTGMTGYQELFTDPSYFGQLLVTTHVHIGNYGIREGQHDESQSDAIQIAGLVCRSFSGFASRSQATGTLERFFVRQNKVGIEGVDTRAVVRHIRSRGAMNAIISSETTDLAVLRRKLAEVPPMAGLELSSLVSTPQCYEQGDPASPFRIAALDLGIKRHILDQLVQRGCYVRVFPARTSLQEMKAWQPHGFFISNGPGDPAAMDYAIQTVAQILDEKLPLFGICLGHQLLALASGVPTFKMHHGHRGLNHPVRNTLTGRCEITSQNHGFAVDADELRRRNDMVVSHINLNDLSVEGMCLLHRPAFSVQYHPESAPGPHDSRYLFDQFLSLLRGEPMEWARRERTVAVSAGS